MREITVRLALAGTFDAVEQTLTGGGDGRSCQCQWWTLTNKEFNATTQAERERLLRSEVDDGTVPGLIAYVDGAAAGWVRIGPRDVLHRVPRTKDLMARVREVPDAGTWVVSCFVVRREFRGLGLTRALLDAAVDHARAGGAVRVEAYPIDLDVVPRSANQLFRGVVSTFLAAGFTETSRPKPDRAVVELLL
jgi:GNAT superfamily N-acetyltransferase